MITPDRFHKEAQLEAYGYFANTHLNLNFVAKKPERNKNRGNYKFKQVIVMYKKTSTTALIFLGARYFSLIFSAQVNQPSIIKNKELNQIRKTPGNLKITRYIKRDKAQLLLNIIDYESFIHNINSPI